jgi:dipeptide transport system substrate-binding protein
LKTVNARFLFLAALVFCSANVYGQQVDKTFVYCAEANPIAFNAQLATDGTTFNASSRTMYNRLVGFEGGSTKVNPSLAKSWMVSANGREVTFKLRENVRFHTTDYFKPTRPFNADDVLFTFSRMLEVKHPYHKVGGGQYPSFQAQQMDQIIEKIERIDSQTVRFTLRRPEAPFLANLAMDFASILSAEYGAKLLLEKKQENIDKLPIGTGPFVFTWYQQGKTIRYRAHPDYFEGRSKVDHLVFLIITDPAIRLQKLQSGACQLMPEPEPSSIAEIKKDINLNLLQQPGLNIAYLAMATEKMPFANLDVRKAIHYALNREKYIQLVYGGNAQIAKNPIPPTMWSYNRRIIDYDYNVQKAKTYLAKAGLPDGFESELWYADVSRPYNPSPHKMAELMKEDLAAVGIKVKLVKLEWQEFLKRSRNGEPLMSIQGWTGDNGDPDNFLNNLLSCQSIGAGNNRSHWCNKRFSFLIDRARVTTNIRQRTKFYEEAQRIFKEEIPWVTVAHSTVFKVARKNIEGFRISPFGVIEFHKVIIK